MWQNGFAVKNASSGEAKKKGGGAGAGSGQRSQLDIALSEVVMIRAVAADVFPGFRVAKSRF